MKFNFERLEEYRLRGGAYASRRGDDFGAFLITGPCGEALTVMASNAWKESDWEHVSVSTRRRIPNWIEMSFIKDLFWADDECVVQYHPAKKDHINCHPYTLHLWRSVKEPFPMPPKVFV